MVFSNKTCPKQGRVTLFFRKREAALPFRAHVLMVLKRREMTYFSKRSVLKEWKTDFACRRWELYSCGLDKELLYQGQVCSDAMQEKVPGRTK